MPSEAEIHAAALVLADQTPDTTFYDMAAKALEAAEAVRAAAIEREVKRMSNDIDSMIIHFKDDEPA